MPADAQIQGQASARPSAHVGAERLAAIVQLAFANYRDAMTEAREGRSISSRKRFNANLSSGR